LSVIGILKKLYKWDSGTRDTDLFNFFCSDGDFCLLHHMKCVFV